jgi:uncharacterized protein Yka (UPF0111/DUF47 family)
MADTISGSPKSKKAVNKEKDIFEQLVVTSELACECGKILNNMFRDDLANGREKANKLKEIESEADTRFHNVVEFLAKAFITPLDREDIMRIAYEMDNVIDSIEDISMRFYMLNISEMKPEAAEFTALIEKMGVELVEVFKQLHNFKKPKQLFEHIVNINTLEGLGDDIYRRAVRDLFMQAGDPITVMKWREMFEAFETCCDSFETLADIIRDVVMKNT